MTNFPTSLDSFTNPGATDKLNSAGVVHHEQHSNLNDAVAAIQAKVGIDNSAVTTSLDYLVRHVLPSQTGNNGKFLTTNGSAASWGNVTITFDAAKNLFIGGGGQSVTGDVAHDLGTDNIGIGAGSIDYSDADAALEDITDGVGNVAIGSGAGAGITIGYQNVCLGHEMGYGITSGNNNTCVGQGGAFGLTTGGQNLFLGNNSTTKPDVVYAIALGSAIVTNDKQCQIGGPTGTGSETVLFWAGATAPADADLATGQGSAFWDFTPSACLFKVKGKDSGGSTFTASFRGTNTGDQTITLTGDVTGSGTGSFATAIGSGKVTNAMLAGSIAASKLVGSDIATVGTITSGTWTGTTIAIANGGTGQTSANNAFNALVPSQTSNSGKFLTTDGSNTSWATVSSPSAANPTASVGLSAVNGSASTFMRSDGAPALSQAIAPTWTALHTFAAAARSSGVASYHVIQTPADTTMTASTESIGIQFGGDSSAATVTRQWATGAITTQRENVFVAPTYAFAASSTITNVATLAITGNPIPGTNATFSNRAAIQIGGKTLISTANPDCINLGATLADTVAVAKCKIKIYDDNSTVYGFGCVAGNVFYYGGTHTFNGSNVICATGIQSPFYTDPNNNKGYFDTSQTGIDFVLVDRAKSSGSPTALRIDGGAHTSLTASAEAVDVNFNLARTVQFSTGALTTQRAVRIQAPTYAFVGASTLTTAVSLEAASPIAGTNATLTNSYGCRFIASAAGHVPMVSQVASSATANSQEWQDNTGAVMAAMAKNGAFKPASLADASAENSTVYYSTTANKLVFKDSGGTVNNLY